MSRIAEISAAPNAASKDSLMKAYIKLLKLRLSLLVVFSAVISYALAAKVQFDWLSAIYLMIGGFFTTGAANILNQIIEKDLDKKMLRTESRPIPSETISKQEAFFVALAMGAVGVFMLSFFMNPLSGLLGFISIILYAFVYTPLKQRTPFAVFIGAFPGAIPAMLGWVAFTGTLDVQAWVLFAIQFIWQFPHFWAIAWVLYDDYAKAGFYLLPSASGQSKASAIQTIFYCLLLIPISLFPVKMGMTGMVYGYIALGAGIIFLALAVNLYRTCSIQAARLLMFGSFLYLPIVQLALLINQL